MVPGVRFDSRLRPWYIDTAAAGRRTWNSIFAYVTPPYPLVVGIGRPLYAPLTHELLGVAALDFELDSIEVILITLWGLCALRSFSRKTQPCSWRRRCRTSP